MDIYKVMLGNPYRDEDGDYSKIWTIKCLRGMTGLGLKAAYSLQENLYTKEGFHKCNYILMSAEQIARAYSMLLNGEPTIDIRSIELYEPETIYSIV